MVLPPQALPYFFANIMTVTADIEFAALVCTEKAAGAKISVRKQCAFLNFSLESVVFFCLCVTISFCKQVTEETNGTTFVRELGSNRSAVGGLAVWQRWWPSCKPGPACSQAAVSQFGCKSKV